MKSLENFRKKVLDALSQLEWSQADLAKRTHIAQPSINVYLSGKKDPNVETCERIASALGLELGSLFLGENIHPTPPHTLDDCLKTIANQIGSALSYSPAQVSNALKQPASTVDHDTYTSEVLALIGSFTKEQKIRALKELKTIKHQKRN